MERKNRGRISLVVVGVAASMALGGCAGFLSSPAAKSRVWVSVPKAPPPVKVEQAPGTVKPGHFWVRGYWDYVPRAGVFQWRPGQFKKARAHRRYVRAKYTQKNGQWRYRIPHWRRARVRRSQPARNTPQPSTSRSTGSDPVTTTTTTTTTN